MEEFSVEDLLQQAGDVILSGDQTAAVLQRGVLRRHQLELAADMALLRNAADNLTGVMMGEVATNTILPNPCDKLL